MNYRYLIYQLLKASSDSEIQLDFTDKECLWLDCKYRFQSFKESTGYFLLCLQLEFPKIEVLQTGVPDVWILRERPTKVVRAINLGKTASDF